MGGVGGGDGEPSGGGTRTTILGRFLSAGSTARIVVTADIFLAMTPLNREGDSDHATSEEARSACDRLPAVPGLSFLLAIGLPIWTRHVQPADQWGRSLADGGFIRNGFAC